jgi:hypothetical protein
MSQDMPDEYDPAPVTDLCNQPVTVASNVKYRPFSHNIRMRIHLPYFLNIVPLRRFRHAIPDVERYLRIRVPP